MKEELMQDDHDRDAWLRPLLPQSMPAAHGDCLDADTLAAWSDGALEPAKAAEAERHASNCSRCMALLASMARTTPPPMEAQPERARALAPVWRWLVPLTAAATAIAIYVALPNRPFVDGPVPGAIERPATTAVDTPAPGGVDAPAGSARQESAPPIPAPMETADREPRPPEAAPPVREPSQRALEPQPKSGDAAADNQAVPNRMRRDADLSAEARQERTVDAFAPPVESLRDRAPTPSPAAPPSAAPSARAAAPPPAGPSAPAPPEADAARSSISAPPSRAAAGAASERFTAEAVKKQMAEQQLLARAVPTSESTAPSDPLVQWRVFGWVAVERSIDGGKTWIKTATPPGVTPNNPPSVWIVSIRAVDNLRAVVLTTARREFYTINGGMSWERVQENSAAPF